MKNKARKKRKKEEGALNITSIEKIEAEKDYRRRIKKIEYILGSILLGSLFVFGFIAASAILNEGAGAFISTIKSMNLFYYSIALLIIFLSYALRFPKWEYYLKKLKVNIPRKKNFIIYLSMYSMDITPGRWGRAVVSYTINKLTKVRFSRTFPAVVADIFTDFLGFAIICVFFAFFVHRYVLVSLTITAILLLPFVFLYHEKPFVYLKSKLSRFKSLKSFFEVGELYFKNNKMLGRDSYWYSMLYTVPSMFLNGLSLYFVMLSFGVDVGVANIPTVVFIFASSLIFGMITGIPANLAVTDGAMLSSLIAFFGGMGLNFGLASIITIFFRIASVWFVELFGFIALAYTFRYWR
ncbi:MAG: lysylphosphatidylglycerol synthase transmembrane domain-containing protein [Candidatus Micrarchaeales archaeon]